MAPLNIFIERSARYERTRGVVGTLHPEAYAEAAYTIHHPPPTSATSTIGTTTTNINPTQQLH